MASKMWSIFLTVVFVQHAQGASLFSRGPQYSVHLSGARLEMRNPEYVAEGANIQIFRASRDAEPVMNGFFPIIQDLPTDVNSSWLCYDKFNNQWRESMMKGTLVLCDVLHTKVKLYRIFFNFSNFPSACPVTAANYTIKNFKFEVEYLPPVVPSSEWRIRNWWSRGDEKIVEISFDIKIDRSKDSRAHKRKPHH